MRDETTTPREQELLGWTKKGQLLEPKLKEEGTMTLAEIKAATERGDGFQITRAGVVYDVGTGEGGEFWYAWVASDPEDAKAVVRFGGTDNLTGRALPEVAPRIYEWASDA